MPSPLLPRNLQRSPHAMHNIFQRRELPQQQRPRMTSSRRWKLLWSYAPDWVLTILLAALFFSLDRVPGFRRSFSLSDSSLRHTYVLKERVPNIALFLICFVTPVVLQPIINVLTIRSWWDLHNSALGLILGLALTGSVTQFSKITVGRPRPDIIDRCTPAPGSVDPTHGLSTSAICTQTDQFIMRDGFRSFPSGHSSCTFLHPHATRPVANGLMSVSFAGLGFLSLYLAGKLHLFDRRGHTGKAWLSLSPLACAALVAISRTMDYRHHWHDVLVGSLLGLTLAYFSYRQYYPSLSSELSHRPYSPRIKRDAEDGVLPTHYHPSEMEQGYLDSTDHNSVELDGTVRREEPESLTHVWKDGEGRWNEVEDIRDGPSDTSSSLPPSNKA